MAVEKGKSEIKERQKSGDRKAENDKSLQSDFRSLHWVKRPIRLQQCHVLSRATVTGFVDTVTGMSWKFLRYLHEFVTGNALYKRHLYLDN